MICFFLLSLSKSLPPYSVVFVSSEKQDDFKKLAKMLDDDSDNFCEEAYSFWDGRDSCKYLYSSLQNAKFSTVSNINKILKKISKYGEFLFIIIMNDAQETIDFNKLKSMNTVFISYEPDMYYRYHANMISSKNLKKFSYNIANAIQKITSRFDNEKNRQFTEICKKLNGPIKNANIKLQNDLLTVSMSGNIKNKVSFLTISNINLRVEHDDLNIHSLYLYNCTIDLLSKNIKTTFFIVDKTTNMGGRFDKIQVEQYGFQILDFHDSFHQLFLFNNQWCVKSENDGLGPNRCYKIPYSCAKSFNWIVCGKHFYITPQEMDFMPTIVNISITTNGPRKSLLSLYPATILPYGNWSQSKYRPKIIATFDPSYFQLTYDSATKSMFSITEEKAYIYIPLNRKLVSIKIAGYCCGASFVLTSIIIFIIIAIIYRPKEMISLEEQLISTA